jgi:hypothetical protein
MTTRNALAILASTIFLVSLVGCSDDAAPIPSHVTAQEMKVYTAWLQSFHKLHPERRIEVSAVTVPIPPNSTGVNAAADRAASDRQAFRLGALDLAAFNELVRLGQAFYPMSGSFDPQLATWRSTCFGGPCPNKESTDVDVEVASVHFSRVVFDLQGKTAFLHVTYSISRGMNLLGSRSFYLAATENGNDWSFKTVGFVALS